MGLLWRKRQDQFGNGFAQWHMMDTVASNSSFNKSTFAGADVFDLTVDPDASSWFRYAFQDPIAHPKNFFWFNQLGDVVFVGFSGAHAWSTQRDLFAEACEFLYTVQHSTNWVVLLGHWDFTEDGTTGTGGMMGTPYGYWKMVTDSCTAFKEYYAHGRMKYVTGHTHCNMANPHDHPRDDADFPLKDNVTGYDGFLVGGMGMDDSSALCGARNNYGMTVMATTPGRSHDLADVSTTLSEDRLELVYFKVAGLGDAKLDYQYDAMKACISRSGWRDCAVGNARFADVWLNVTAKPWDRNFVWV